jgi:hypothetical protein
MYSLAQSAKAAGKSKPTIARVKAGRLSATRGDDGRKLLMLSNLATGPKLVGMHAFPSLPVREVTLLLSPYQAHRRRLLATRAETRYAA